MIDDVTADNIKMIAETIGLGLINYKNDYRLYKVGEKRKDGTIETCKRQYRSHGCVSLVGNSSSVCLYVSNLSEWFRTSAVLSCKKSKNCIIIETANSFYELMEET
jgi:hypothetical protein